MQYKTLLEYETVDRLRDELARLQPGVWLMDLDPKCDKILLGPFDTVAEAHDNRDFIWHYGDRFGRYLWLVLPSTMDKLRGRLHSIQHIELGVDTLPLEVVGMRIKIEGVKEWVTIPRKRMAR